MRNNSPVRFAKEDTSFRRRIFVLIRKCDIDFALHYLSKLAIICTYYSFDVIPNQIYCQSERTGLHMSIDSSGLMTDDTFPFYPIVFSAFRSTYVP